MVGRATKPARGLAGEGGTAVKKILVLVVLLMAVVAAMGLTTAVAADCAGPVSVDCTDTKGTSTTDDDEHCLVFVDIVEAGARHCIGESDLPA